MPAQIKRTIYDDILEALSDPRLGLEFPHGRTQTVFQKILDMLENPAPIKDEETYRKYRGLSSTLCSLSCTTSNRSLPENDQVWSLEAQYNRRMHTWMKKTRLIQDPLTKVVCKLLSWNKIIVMYATSGHWAKLADHALANGALFKDEDGDLVVAGFNYKIGDNVFSVDDRGREHRQYLNSASPQAFRLGGSPRKLLDDMGWARDKIIPDLPEEYRVTYQGDGKGCVKNHRVSKAEERLIRGFFQG